MKPMQGIRVVEVALFALVPAAGAVLSDWGAEVIKVEHPTTGDPVRGLDAFGVKPGAGGFTYLWEIFNRGKRSIGIDLATPEGRELLYDLVRDADVFLTSFLPAARRKLRIDADDILAINPRIIYGRGSGYGPKGPEAEKGGFDGITYWQRTGVASAVAAADATEVVGMPGPAFGDIQGAMTLAGGVSAALFERGRTGKGCVVDTSLFATGMWTMQASLVGANMLGRRELPKFPHSHAPNPVGNSYKTADGRFVTLAMLQADRYWPRLCELIGRPELATDPKFADMENRNGNNVECIAILDQVMATKTLAEWVDLLGQQEGQWEVVRQVGDLNEDEQAWANGYLQTVDYGDGRTISMVSAPAQFNETPPELRPAPELGANTEEILLERGLSWDDIEELKNKGVIN